MYRVVTDGVEPGYRNYEIFIGEIAELAKAKDVVFRYMDSKVEAPNEAPFDFAHFTNAPRDGIEPAKRPHGPPEATPKVEPIQSAPKVSTSQNRSEGLIIRSSTLLDSTSFISIPSFSAD